MDQTAAPLPVVLHRPGLERDAATEAGYAPYRTHNGWVITVTDDEAVTVRAALAVIEAQYDQRHQATTASINPRGSFPAPAQRG